MQKDLTTGSVFKNVLYFSLPYLLSYFLQTLYGMADLFIIGQFEGTASITAVSIGSQIMHMITVMLVGLAMGVTVGIGRAVGAHDDRGAGAVIGNAVMLFLAVSVAMAAVLTALVQPILSMMSTPAEAVPGAAPYLTSVDLPEPDTPVTQTILPSGKSTVMSCRLFSWALTTRRNLPLPGRRVSGTSTYFRPERYAPVMLRLTLQMSATLPAATISPPCTPAPGPTSTI